MKTEKDPKIFLSRILESIKAIEKCTKRISKGEFFKTIYISVIIAGIIIYNYTKYRVLFFALILITMILIYKESGANRSRRIFFIVLIFFFIFFLIIYLLGSLPWHFG